MGAGSPYLYSPKNWVTHSPREAQGRWKLRSHPFSPQVMAAPISPQTKHRWKEHSSLAQGQAQGLHGRPLGSRQGAGCGHCWLPARRPAWCTRLVPGPEPLWSCWEQAFVPELVEGLGFLSAGPGGAPASASWCKAPCSCQVLTFWLAAWIARLVSSARKPFPLSRGKSSLARNCRAEKAGSSLLGQQGRDHPRQKAGGRTHQAVCVGTEPFRCSFAPTDSRISLCPAAQHACWRGESKRCWERAPLRGWGSVPAGLPPRPCSGPAELAEGQGWGLWRRRGHGRHRCPSRCPQPSLGSACGAEEGPCPRAAGGLLPSPRPALGRRQAAPTTPLSATGSCGEGYVALTLPPRVGFLPLHGEPGAQRRRALGEPPPRQLWLGFLLRTLLCQA